MQPKTPAEVREAISVLGSYYSQPLVNHPPRFSKGVVPRMTHARWTVNLHRVRKQLENKGQVTG